MTSLTMIAADWSMPTKKWPWRTRILKLLQKKLS